MQPPQIKAMKKCNILKISARGGPQPFYAFECCFFYLPTQPICSFKKFVCPPTCGPTAGTPFSLSTLRFRLLVAVSRLTHHHRMQSKVPWQGHAGKGCPVWLSQAFPSSQHDDPSKLLSATGHVAGPTPQSTHASALW